MTMIKQHYTCYVCWDFSCFFPVLLD